ncbi:putative peptidase C18A7.01 [Hypsizygus marmoreus]|uniref:Peptidase C18A7.01 n=1 Tax=Hypsizygus marmoreus TaxID=39966 RepID=A0A369JJ04_HYPMA|nr:putative peptidase C18A7.01 [Hypsizygus marmoreus]
MSTGKRQTSGDESVRKLPDVLFHSTRRWKAGILYSFVVWLTLSSYISSRSQWTRPIPPFAHLENHCANLHPISSSEFHRRQTTLAAVLRSLNASAYIAEPGASATFYGNISNVQWKLSERPLLLIVTPVPSGDNTKAKISLLTPKFEATRAKALPIPSEVDYIEWPEDGNPYHFVTSILHHLNATVFLDGSIRKFLADGLQEALPNVTIVTAPNEVTQLRERKSDAEIDLLKCANEATLITIRAVHKKLYFGVRESEARTMMASALSAVGLKKGGCLTLFGENAALPHGSGTDRVLTESDLALFDCTGSLHGYFSDVTRTVALPGSKIPLRHRQIWEHIKSAQKVALLAARASVLTKEVDAASRTYLALAGYASYFTHRLGHGIGLEVHEEPYLRGGSNTSIKIGHTFSNEPGVYIENEVGVRLEDCFFINKEGEPVLLTQGIGGQSASPWSP